ncbi:MAG: hypothetical protein ACJ72I_24405 [Pseudonocardiaceae bacterium]|jgi:hypothetical protein
MVEAFTHLPVGKPQLVGAQIHDATHDISVFRLEGTDLYITNGNNPPLHTRHQQLPPRNTIRGHLRRLHGQIRG